MMKTYRVYVTIEEYDEVLDEYQIIDDECVAQDLKSLEDAHRIQDMLVTTAEEN